MKLVQALVISLRLSCLQIVIVPNVVLKATRSLLRQSYCRQEEDVTDRRRSLAQCCQRYDLGNTDSLFVPILLFNCLILSLSDKIQKWCSHCHFHQCNPEGYTTSLRAQSVSYGISFTRAVKYLTIIVLHYIQLSLLPHIQVLLI